MFGIIAQVVGAVAGGVRKKDEDEENAALSGEEAAQQAADTWEDNEAVNKSIQETNLQNAIRTGYRVGVVNIQRAQARQEAAAAGNLLGRQKLTVLGANDANVAAAGSIGSSVQAVASDIEMAAGRAAEGLVQDQRVREFNMDNELTGILQAGEDAIVAPQTVSVRRASRPRVTSAMQNALPGLLQIGASYLSDKMTLGLGKGPGNGPGKG